MWRDKTAVPLCDYIDRSLADLSRYHDKAVDDLQAEIDRRFGEVQRETEGRFREQATALQAAADAMDKRLDGMNEFREQIRDVTAHKVDEAFFRQATDGLAVRLERAEAALERQRGRMGAYIAGTSFLMLAIAVLTLVVNHYRLLGARVCRTSGGTTQNEGPPVPLVETKVKASTAAAALSGLLLFVLGKYVFKGSAPDVVASWVYATIPALITLAAGYFARHTHRPPPVPPRPPKTLIPPAVPPAAPE